MDSKEEQICSYLSSIYLPKYFIKHDNGLVITFNAENILSLVNQEFSFDELYDYIRLHENQMEEQVSKQLFDKIFEPEHFTVDQLIKIQKSDEPFSEEELFDLVESEFDRPCEEMNTDVINYCLDEIERMIK